MRTPQQIEEVNAYRALVTEHAHMYRPEYVSAIKALFDAAERFDALESALWLEVYNGRRWRNFKGRRKRHREVYAKSLAELADQLKGKQ